MSTREIPDLPADDYRFMITILVDSHGRPRQLKHELQLCFERMLLNEFGKAAVVTNIVRTNEITLTDDKEE